MGRHATMSGLPASERWCSVGMHVVHVDEYHTNACVDCTTSATPWWPAPGWVNPSNPEECWCVTGAHIISVSSARPRGTEERPECHACHNVYLRKRYFQNPGRFMAYRRQRRALRAGLPTDNHSHPELLESWSERDFNGCALNGPNCTGGADEIEHSIPEALGGGTTIGNLRPACFECNRGAGGKFENTPAGWALKFGESKLGVGIW